MKFEDICNVCPPDCGNADHRLLYDAVIAAPAGAVIEIGVYMGGSSMFLCGAADEKNDHLVCIDPWDLVKESQHNFQIKIKRPRTLEAHSRSNLAKTGLSNYTVIKSYSYEVAKVFNRPIGMVFIDGCHCVECVKKDFFLWAPKMVPGGKMVFHDAGWVDVAKALREIEASTEFKNFHRDPNASIQTYVRKK